MSAFPPGRLVVVSPHLDDAVFGCGALIAASPGALVVTVFAGVPDYAGRITGWDRACGFGPGDDPVGARRAEDAGALALLQAQPLWLDFRDSQYGGDYAAEAIRDAIDNLLLQRDPSAVALPLGLFHADHVRVHVAALPLVARKPQLEWYAYEDAIYRSLPGLLHQRLAALAADGVEATPADWDIADHAQAKQRAVARYGSQLRGLDRAWGSSWRRCLAAPERCWRLCR